MSSSQNIANRDHSTDIAPTPQNTPLDTAVLANRPANMGKPKVAAVEEGDDEDDEDDEDVGAMNPASLLAQNPALLALAQHKLGDLVGRDSGYISSLPAPVRRRIDALKGVQVEHSKIESEFQMAILDLEKKFLEKYKPFYERRAAIIAGSAEPTEEEVETGKNADSDDEDDEDEDDEEEGGAKIEEVKEEGDRSASDVKGIPEFWLTALRNHRNVSDYITDEDEEALKHLQDITLSYLSDKPGFSLHFSFAPNPFFENKELTKTYYYRDTVGYGGDLVYDLAKGTEIKWKENKDLTKKVEIKKQRNKSTGRTRVIRKVVPTDSFFNFFSPPTPPSPEAVEAGDVDEEEIEELDAKLEVDYLLGEDFKEKIIPRAVDYFTGRALRYEEDSEEEFDEDDFEDEDVSDEDDDEEAERRGGAGAAAGGAGEQGECKQQ